MSKYLSREAILSAQDLPAEDVAVPEWGGVVRVRALTGSERDAFEASLVKGQGKQAKMDVRNIRAKLLSLTIVDADGTRLFTQADVEALGQKSAAALDRAYAVAQRLSGLNKADMEELSGNSGAGQPGDSHSV